MAKGKGSGITAAEMARRIDSSLLRAGTTREEVIALCEEARRHRFRAVCIHPAWVEAAASTLAGSDTAVCTVVGFPLGAHLLEVKALEARQAIGAGAQEIDMVIDLGALRTGDDDRVRQEVETIAGICRAGGAVLKVIIEAAILNPSQKDTACRIAKEGGAGFVKTSTGFESGGATPDDVRFIAERVAPALGVKAAGGIRTAEAALSMIAAGATRIGTSAGPAILAEMDR